MLRYICAETVLQY